MISRTLSLTSTAGSPRRGSSTDRNIGKGAAGTPLPFPLRSDLLDGAALLFCVVAIVAWGFI
jgi:hypothetical protein